MRLSDMIRLLDRQAVIDEVILARMLPSRSVTYCGSASAYGRTMPSGRGRGVPDGLGQTTGEGWSACRFPAQHAPEVLEE
jgi:hypothetical protein